MMSCTRYRNLAVPKKMKVIQIECLAKYGRRDYEPISDERA